MLPGLSKLFIGITIFLHHYLVECLYLERNALKSLFSYIIPIFTCKIIYFFVFIYVGVEIPARS